MIFVFYVLISNAVWAQEINWIVAGKVLEKGTKKPIQGAAISVQELDTLTTVSDENGNFVLSFFQAGNFTVLATTIGVEKPETQAIILGKNILPPKLLTQMF